MFYNKSDCTTTMLQYCASRVLALCNIIVATMLWFCESFFFFFLLNIDVSWYLYCYTDTTNFTIFLQLLTYQFLTSWNKIIKYETIATTVLWHCASKVLALCSTIAATVLWFREFFFFFPLFVQPFCLFNWHYSYNA